MKVGLVTQQFPSPEHPYITDWVLGLQQAGVELTILAERLGPQAAEISQKEQLNIARLNDIHHPRSALSAQGKAQGLPDLPRWADWMRQMLATQPKWVNALRKGFEYLPLSRQAFDLLHFNAPQIAIRRFELGKLFGCPTLVSFRGQDISFHPERYDRLLREADHLHFISQDLLRQARARGFEGENFTLIPPLVEPAQAHINMREIRMH